MRHVNDSRWSRYLTPPAGRLDSEADTRSISELLRQRHFRKKNRDLARVVSVDGSGVVEEAK